VLYLHAQHGGARQPRVQRHLGDADREHGVAEAGTEDRDDHDGQQQGGERHEHVHGAHQRAIRPAARPRRQGAERNAAEHREADRHEADGERDARAPDRARQHVAAQAVGAERMAPRRAPKIGAERDGLRIVRRNPRGQHRHRREGQHDGGAEARAPVADEAPPGLPHSALTRGSSAP
jgi:hypothetical protein